MEKNKYISIWKETLPNILATIKEGRKNANLCMVKEDFIAAGNRKSYRFRLQTENGEVTNNIGGSAVARDLYDVLSANTSFKELAAGRRIVFKMGVEYKLSIEIQTL